LVVLTAPFTLCGKIEQEMKSASVRRTTIAVVLIALLASVGSGVLIGQLGSDETGTGNSGAIASPRPIIATPVGTFENVPPFFGMNTERQHTLFPLDAW
jgi:hypothetical protein